jgi:hypothetical protein
MSVLQNITDTCDGLGDITLSGIRLEDAESNLLDVSTGALDQHVAMQPAAMAYYLMLKKAAKRRMDNAKSAYDRWEKRHYALARAAVESGTTAKSSIKVEDVKARFIVDNEPEIEKWEKRMDSVRAEYDTLDVWCEAWKQKSFSLREFVEIDADERWNSSDSITSKNGDRIGAKQKGGELTSEGIARVRKVIRKNQTP